jgi:drug/metabolite transporter (DMT)-like permease
MNVQILGVSAALCSAASWAIAAILFKQLGERILSPAMTWAKGIISIVLLAAVLAFTGVEAIDAHTFLLLAASGLLGIGLGDTFFFEALQGLGPHAVVLLLMLSQVLTVVLAVVLLGETLTPAIWLGIMFVVFGIGIVLYTKLAGSRETSRWSAIMYGLLSVGCMSVSIIIAKQGLESVSAMQATFIRMLAGTAGIFLLGIGAGKLRNWMKPFRDVKLASHFIVAVVVVTFGGFWLSLVAIKHIDVSIANTLISTEPLFILPLAAIFLKERITFQALVGTLIAIPGVFLLCLA